MEKKNHSSISTRQGILALSPILVFLLLYVAVSVIIGDFYKMPLSIAFIVASVWAITLTKNVSIEKRIALFSRGAANENILYMIWIFVLAGAFTALAKGIGSIDATVNLALSILPPQLLIPGLFIAACFISISIGTSVGTIVAITPFAVELAGTIGGNTAFFVAVVIGGSFFGDNLSFISDTTIAATRSQLCKMNDKFKANIKIALPAAIIALIAYSVMGQYEMSDVNVSNEFSPILIIPYLLVIITASIGMNVLIVLALGIVSALFIASFLSDFALIDMCEMLGKGVNGMGDLIVVTLLAAGLLEIIRHNGGIKYLIGWLTKKLNGKRGALAAIAVLVSIVNLCTANNTIAIITVGDISHQIAERFNLAPRQVASVLDTCSCIVQSVIPYGAQVLLAAGIAQLAPIAFLPYLYYTIALAFLVALSIVFSTKK